MSEKGTTITLAVSSEPGRNRLEKLVASIDRLSLLGKGSPADILIVEADPQDKTFARVRKILGSTTAAEVFLTCADPSPEFLIKAMRLGISEFLPMPVDRKDLALAVERHRARQGQPESPVENGKVIVVAGAKPGIGTTTLAVNLALEFQRLQGSTALLDLRQPMGEIPLFLDLEYGYTWGDVVQNLTRLDTTYLQSVMARHASGVSVLASPGGQIMSGDDGAQAVERMFEELRKSFGMVVVDADPGLETFHGREMELADQIVLNMVLSLPCLAHAKRVLEQVRRVQGLEKRVRLVANRYHKDADISPRDAEDILQKKIALAIPDDYRGTLTAINQGRPLIEAAPKSPVLKSLTQMAKGLSRGHSIKGGGALSGLLGGRTKRAKSNELAAGMGAL